MLRFVRAARAFRRGARPARARRALASGPPKFSDREKEVLRALKAVTDGKGKDVVYSGLIEGVRATDEGLVSVSLQLTEEYRILKKRCQEVIEKLDWVDKARVSMASAPARGEAGPGGAPQRPSDLQAPAKPSPNGLRGVKRVVAVSSCKGGVGKSTVSVNLAYALSQAGHRVGIFDADVYGPSLPTMVMPADPALRLAPETDLIVPPVYEDVKLMSYGFSNLYDPVSPDPKARQSTVMRGPMASGLVQRLVTETDWGDLDYLVVDFPPGTGDIQLTLAQTLEFDSAVVVTTPQRLAHVDVVKGMDMFDKVRVPIIGVVENMSYFDCPKCGERSYPFGTGATKDLAALFGIGNLFELPIRAEISAHSDGGDPVALSKDPALASVVEAYASVASMVVTETARLAEAKTEHGAIAPKVATADGGSTVVVTRPGGAEARVEAVALRRACRSAGNRNPESVDEGVVPVTITPRGNYAVSVAWSDGHNSIYPYEQIESMCEWPQ